MVIISSRESFVRGMLRTLFCILVVLKVAGLAALASPASRHLPYIPCVC